MNTKTSVIFSIIGIVAAVLLFAAGPLIATHQIHKKNQKSQLKEMSTQFSKTCR